MVTLTDNAINVMHQRYLARNDSGELIETPDELFWRVAINIASADSAYTHAASDDTAKIFHDMMTRLDFLPNSPCLGNAGRRLQMLSACFVLPVPDDIKGIFSAVKAAATIHQAGGGTGMAFSRLRPKGSPVRSTNGVASGPVSFMNVFNHATEAIKQGGVRRGANMGVLRVDHPDILEFIECKADMVSLTNFNISVTITNAFMLALESGNDYDLINPMDGSITGQYSAKSVWDRLIYNAWKNGDPGVIFIDRVNELNPVRDVAEIESSNPCGEEMLAPNDSCTLGSINVANFVVDAQVDWGHLSDCVEHAVHFLDNVLDMNVFPTAEIEEVTLANRRIGLGVMGFADALFKMRIPYTSKDALHFADRLMRFIRARADAASLELAKQRGVFPNWRRSEYAKAAETSILKYRNAERTTVAPTGTISIIADCSSGIEPVFSLAFIRQHNLDKHDATKPIKMIEVNSVFEAEARARGFYSEELIEYLIHGGKLADRPEVPDDVKKVYVTTMDVTAEQHVLIQAAFQRHVGNSISKTINFPASATESDVDKVYRLAWREGCKGVTIYRDGSRNFQVMSHKRDEPIAVSATPQTGRKLLPDTRQATTHRFTVAGQSGYITAGLYDDKTLGEIFLRVSRQGSTVNGLMDAIARLASVALQYGVPLAALTDQLRGARFEPAGLTSNPDIPAATSIVDYVARYLDLNFLDKQSVAATLVSGVGCPDCGSILEYVEGCLLCRSCGFSRCG